MRGESSDSLPSLDLEEVPTIKRKGLLPPIHNATSSLMEPNLPGGINFTSQSPIVRRKSLVTMISPSSPRHSITSFESVDLTLASILTPSNDWLDAVKHTHGSFISLKRSSMLDLKWFNQVLDHYLNQEIIDQYHEEGTTSKASAIKLLLQDQILTKKLDEFLDGCTRLVYGSHPGCDLEDIAAGLGPGLAVRAFSGVTQASSLAKVPELLKKVALPAFQSAVKLALDQILIQGDSYMSNDELCESLEDIDTNWHLGLENTMEWGQALRSQVPNLFTITSCDLTNSGGSSSRQSYRSHLLTLRQCSIQVGRLNSEVVRSLWASLSWELLYLTNDDDERYSIQAEERLLRNLTVEVADPPLGYPSYTSNAIRHGLEYF